MGNDDVIIHFKGKTVNIYIICSLENYSYEEIIKAISDYKKENPQSDDYTIINDVFEELEIPYDEVDFYSYKI